MRVSILWGLRKEAYEDEYQPEVLAAWDEGVAEENPEWVEKEIAKHKAEVGDQMAGMQVIDFQVSVSDIRELLIGRPEIKAKMIKPSHCGQCGKAVNSDGSPVLWKCQVCQKNVCRDCTRTIPGKQPPEYHHMTLCSEECWDKAGRPME
jgi:hypothetical protein